MPTPFHEQLLLFLQKDLQNKRQEEGWDEQFDPEVRSFSDEISRSLRQQSFYPLERLIEQRQKLLVSRPIDPELHLFRNFPKLRMMRGLPRLYWKEDPSQSKIVPKCTSLACLKKIIALGSICKLYDQVPLPKDVRIIVTGNKILSKVIAEEFLEVFPYLKVEKKEEEIDGLVLEADTQKIFIRGLGGEPHEQAMGLHFLERGVVVSKEKEASSSSFYFADLRTVNGAFVYFHALLNYLQEDDQDIAVCVPDFSSCATYFEQRKKKPFEKNYGIKTLVFEIDGYIAVHELADEGKKLRIFSSEQEANLSDEFFACGSEGSFAKALSNKKFLFFDFPDKKRSILKDLIALAKNRLSQNSAVVDLLRIYDQMSGFQEEKGWVDELQWKEPIDLLEAAEIIARELNNSEIKIEFQKLSRIVSEEYSCNKFLLNLVQRAVCHRRRPKLERKEQDILHKFLKGECSFCLLIEEMQESIF